MTWAKGVLVAGAIAAGGAGAIGSASAQGIFVEPSVGVGVGIGGSDWYPDRYDEPGYGPRYGSGSGYDQGPGVRAYGEPYVGYDAYARRPIDREEAIAIARGSGLVRVEEVERDGSRFKVEGWDDRGDDIEVTIDRNSGAVLAVDD